MSIHGGRGWDETGWTSDEFGRCSNGGGSGCGDVSMTCGWDVGYGIVWICENDFIGNGGSIVGSVVGRRGEDIIGGGYERNISNGVCCVLLRLCVVRMHGCVL